MYQLEWGPRAAEDLNVKVSSERVVRELVRVAREALDEPPDGDGGQLGPFLWRRGILPRRREELDTAISRGADPPDAGDAAWNYVLVYVRRVLRPGFKVLAVLTNGELAAGLESLPTLDFVS